MIIKILLLINPNMDLNSDDNKNFIINFVSLKTMVFRYPPACNAYIGHLHAVMVRLIPQQITYSEKARLPIFGFYRKSVYIGIVKQSSACTVLHRQYRQIYDMCACIHFFLYIVRSSSTFHKYVVQKRYIICCCLLIQIWS